MLNLKSTSAALAFVAVMVTSCSHEDQMAFQPKVETTSVISQDVINFKGLNVKHKAETPLEILDYEEADFQKLLVDSFSKKNGRNMKLASFQYPSLEELVEIINDIEKDYPNVYSPTPEEADSIRAQFPGLTDEDIDKNLETIDAYYEQNMKYDIIQALTEREKTSVGSRTSGYAGTELCRNEFWVVFGRPRAASSVEDAAYRATEMTDALYAKPHHQNRADAFRHGIWSVLIAKYYGTKKDDINKGIDLAKEFGDAHEQCNKDEDGASDYDLEMDYRNNWVGREHFANTAYFKKVGNWPFRRNALYAKSDDDYKNDIKNKTDKAVKVSKSRDAVLATHPSMVYFED